MLLVFNLGTRATCDTDYLELYNVDQVTGKSSFVAKYCGRVSVMFYIIIYYQSLNVDALKISTKTSIYDLKNSENIVCFLNKKNESTIFLSISGNRLKTISNYKVQPKNYEKYRSHQHFCSVTYNIVG